MRPPICVTGLHVRERACLCRLYQTTRCPRTRLRVQMVLLSSDGYPVAQIASITRQSDDTVRRWLKRFLSYGWRGLLEAPHSGRPPMITPAVEQFLYKCLQGSPRDYQIGRPTWTTDLLAQVVRRRLKIGVTGECIRQHLERIEGVCRRPTWTVKHLAELQPGYAQKKAGLPGFCAFRQVGPMFTFKMKLNSACFRPSRVCGCCAAGNARFGRPASIHPSDMSVPLRIGAPARSYAFAPRNATRKPSVAWPKNAWRVRQIASDG